MPIVTLTTDFGAHSFYVAALKGALWTQNEQLSIIDVAHTINPYDIVQGAFILGNVFAHYPQGSFEDRVST